MKRRPGRWIDLSRVWERPDAERAERHVLSRAQLRFEGSRGSRGYQHWTEGRKRSSDRLPDEEVLGAAGEIAMGIVTGLPLPPIGKDGGSDFGAVNVRARKYPDGDTLGVTPDQIGWKCDWYVMLQVDLEKKRARVMGMCRREELSARPVSNHFPRGGPKAPKPAHMIHWQELDPFNARTCGLEELVPDRTITGLKIVKGSWRWWTDGFVGDSDQMALPL